MWEKIAHDVEIIYGTFVDWEERFFICPECDEPIYEADWNDEDYMYGLEDTYMCPICENMLIGEGID